MGLAQCLCVKASRHVRVVIAHRGRRVRLGCWFAWLRRARPGARGENSRSLGEASGEASIVIQHDDAGKVVCFPLVALGAVGQANAELGVELRRLELGFVIQC